MFGSLVVVFPTHHEGGALFLRHRGREWIFDPGQALAGRALNRPSIGYVAFLNDVEQDVAPVTSGHCVTLTYNLYFDDDGRCVTGKYAVSKLLIPPKPPNQDGFREAFIALLENPEFVADGGTLVFGLRHVYPIPTKYFLEPVYDILKGSDAVVYRSARALGFEPTLYMYFEEWNFRVRVGMIIDKVVQFSDRFSDPEQYDVNEILQEEGGIPVREDGGEIYEYDFAPDIHRAYLKDPEPIEWVTPGTTYNRAEREQDACMVVRIGKVGDRLGYPTVAQIKNACEQSGYGYRYYR